MAICIGPSASAVYVAPTLTVNASTNYNQNSGVLNATVTATGNRPITSVEFQWSTSSDFSTGNSAWTAASTNTLIPQGTANTARTVTATGLESSTVSPAVTKTYYVRFRATNANGFVATSSVGGSFATYKLITEQFTSSRTWTNPRTTSGTSGAAITQILNLDCRAGGAGGWVNGAGGAGARSTSSSASVGSSVAVTIGGGGAGKDAYSGTPGTGSSSSIASFISVSGGNPGDSSFNTNNGGSSGNGNAGGAGIAFAVGGGGGGTNGVGGAASDAGGVYTPGSGGAGWTSGYGEGGRGGGYGYSVINGPAYTGNGGSGSGDDFTAGGNGGSGYAQFQYYGP